MKISQRLIITIVVLSIAFIVVLQRDRKNNLPDGKITETQPIDIAEISPEPISGHPQVEFSTSKGKFIIELRPDLAPESTVNFLNKWAVDYCDNTTFHRVEDWVVQGCDPEGNGLGGKNTLPTESSTESFLTGSVGAARRPYPKESSNDSQFFIVKKDSLFLDGEYTYLGRITSGMDVINKLAAGDVILSTTVLTK
jgi:cyclophilin family peptidyl-prolyl cis-trans isomerase